MKKVFIHLGLLFIIFGLSILLVDSISSSLNSYYEDLEESKKIVDDINLNYDLFKEKSLNVKDNIKDVSVSFDFYLDEFEEKNIDLVKKINNIENEIIEISDISVSISKDCNYDLNNKNMDSKCNNYKANYKNMIESYNEMIDVYNKVIDTYNEYQKEEDKEQVDNYKSKIDKKVEEVLVSIS